MNSGGLGLMCVATKSECLLLRQSLRILQREEENCFKHLGYWTGSFLEDSFPALGEAGPKCPTLNSQFPLHKSMLESIQESVGATQRRRVVRPSLRCSPTHVTVGLAFSGVSCRLFVTSHLLPRALSLPFCAPPLLPLFHHLHHVPRTNLRDC